MPKQRRLPLPKEVRYLSSLVPPCAALIHRSGSNSNGLGNRVSSVWTNQVSVLTGVYGIIPRQIFNPAVPSSEDNLKLNLVDGVVDLPRQE